MFIELMIRKNYQFVLIRAPYEIIGEQAVGELFPKIIQFKAEGYQKEYGQFVLPFDSSDFVATHLLLCEKGPGGVLTPVLGFKSVTLERCDNHRITFPIMNFFEGEEGRVYAETIRAKLDHYRTQDLRHKIAYNGSFTINPRLRENKVLMKSLWDITFSLLTNYYIDYGIDHVMALCVCKFNVHLKKEQLGWNYIQGPAGPLPSFVSRVFFEATLMPMELTDVRAKSQESAQKFQDMWRDRITLDAESFERIKKAA